MPQPPLPDDLFLPEPDQQDLPSDLFTDQELHLDPSQYGPQPQPQQRGMPPASPTFVQSAWDAINKPVSDYLTDASGNKIFDPAAAANYYDDPNARTEDQWRIPSWVPGIGGGTYRSLGAGMLEGAGDVVRGFTSPLNAAITLASAGTVRGVPGASTAVKALSAPVVAHGAYQTATGESLADRMFGVAEMAGGGAGMFHTPPVRRPGILPEIRPEMSAAEHTYSFDASSGDIVNQEMVRARQRADDIIHKSPSQLAKEDYLKKMSYEQLEAEAQKNIEKNIQSGGMPSPADIEHFKMVDKELVNRPQYKQKINAEIGAEFAPKGGEEAYNAARPNEPTPGATEESIYRNTADRLGMAQELPESSVEPIPELAPTKKPFDPSSLRGLKRANEPVNEAPQSHEEATHKTNTGEQAQTHEEATTRRLPSQSDNTPIGKYGRGKTNEINAAQDVENRPASAAEIAATTTNKRFEQYVVYDKAGNKRVLTGPEAEHYAEAGPAEGETYGVETPRGFVTKADRGGNVTGTRIKRARKEGPGFKGQASPESGGGGGKPPNESFDLPLNQPPGGEPPSGGGGPKKPTRLLRGSELQKGIPIKKRAAPEVKKASFLREAANLPKGLMSVDIPFLTSAAFRQGLPEAFTPSWFRAWRKSALSFGSEKVSKAIRADIMRDKYFEPRYELGHNIKGELQYVEKPSVAEAIGVRLTDIGHITQGEEQIAGTWAEKTPVWGKYVRASQRQYADFLNSLRKEKLHTLLDELYAQGRDPEVDLRLGKRLGQYINDATGRGDIGFELFNKQIFNLDENAAFLSDIFWSPRNLASRVRMLNITNWANTDPFVRNQYIKGLARTVGAWGAFSTLGALAGANVSLDPTNSDLA